jgi:hypothetical protein
VIEAAADLCAYRVASKRFARRDIFDRIFLRHVMAMAALRRQRS